MKRLFTIALLMATATASYGQDSDHKYPSGYVTKDLKPNAYIDMCIAPLGEVETAKLDAARGQWRRPTYTQVDPQFADEWAKVTSYEIPEWVLDAKFGIYTHWGVYSVPAYGGNTYCQDMYSPKFTKQGKEIVEGDKAYDYHAETYAHHLNKYGGADKVGYTDFIPQFKAEKFSGEKYVQLMKDMGAKFGGLGLVHHDGFLMWDSEVNRWNVGNMGPKRDIYGEFVEAARKANFRTVGTFHHARTWNFVAKATHKEFFTEEQKSKLDLYDPENGDFFWGATDDPRFSVEVFADQWRRKIREVVDKYHPDMIWFDGIQRTSDNSPEKYVVEVLNHYLKEGTKRGQEPVLCNKLPGGGSYNFPENTGLRCFEGGRDLPPDAGGYYLVDRAISYPWGYVEDKNYNLTADVHIREMVNHISRGGIFLLSLTPMASGELHPKEMEICMGIGEWMKVNGEAIYSSRRWVIPAEGSTTMWNIEKGRLRWNFKKPAKEGDYRFTQSKDGKTIYAIMLEWPKSGEALITSMCSGSEYLKKKINSVELIGSDAKLEWEQTPAGLKIKLPKDKPCKYAYSFRIR